MADRRAAYFADKSCVQCGSTDRLELDHIDRATKIANSIWSWSAERQAAELAKCQVLCHDCHQAKTDAENRALLSLPKPHGTELRYRQLGCRCVPCKRAAAEARNARRRRAKGEVMPLCQAKASRPRRSCS